MSPLPNTFEEIKLKIILTSSANSHSEFLLKCPNLLWKNPDFYISLPFKKDETANSTKANHLGMNPDHLKQVVDECSQLLSQELIEATTSSWACEAFYVNKRSEQVCGKLRLVINYKPLNQFLVDDKFPFLKSPFC